MILLISGAKLIGNHQKVMALTKFSSDVSMSAHSEATKYKFP
ncbi:hypothetical protein HG66A1_08800 [Gimesia chilikensis]|jgi:hypothetical protein|uniref:Uncharacterized protein n=1 Tax=Gimesia chilikensis TaxID=2605989 RepID=A0A517PIB6_9PLAN|nr:hypothetical protein HG66A1_08800 [Gimesia chilikensis]QDT83227.1 hypothetical protein MalM14_08580 [Gimesia chilikensis]